MRSFTPIRVFSVAIMLSAAPLLSAHAQSAPAAAASAPPATSSIAAEDLAMAAKPLRTFYNALLYSMKHAQQLGIDGRYKHLKPAIDGAFDFEMMTKFMVGDHWKAMTPAQQKQLTQAFGRLTMANYASNFDGFSGEDFTVSPKVELRSGDAIVSTEMTRPGQAAIPFVYRMHKTVEGWRIVDIYLNGYISEIAQRRADFQSTLQSGGADALISKLEAMATKTLNS